MPFFVGAFRAPSAVRLAEGDAVRVRALIGGRDREVILRTSYDTFGSGGVPRAFWVEVRGKARTLIAARSGFQDLAEAITNIACLTMAAAVEPLHPFVVFDASPDRNEHEYWQLVPSVEQGFPRPSRLLDPSALDSVVSALESHDHRELINRAIGFYRESIRHTVPDEWLLALAYGWMGIEALKPVVLDRELQRRRLTRAQLASQWGVKTSVLDNEARRRLLFAGRPGLHDRTRSTSNDLEHALASFGALQQRAARDAVALVVQLRRVLMRSLFARLPRALSRRELAVPLPCAQLQEVVEAEFVGSAADLAPEDGPYPHLEVVSEPTDVQLNADGTFAMTRQTTFTARMGPGVTARPANYQIWGAHGTRRRGG